MSADVPTENGYAVSVYELIQDTEVCPYCGLTLGLDGKPGTAVRHAFDEHRKRHYEWGRSAPDIPDSDEEDPNAHTPAQVAEFKKEQRKEQASETGDDGTVGVYDVTLHYTASSRVRVYAGDKCDAKRKAKRKRLEERQPIEAQDHVHTDTWKADEISYEEYLNRQEDG